MLFVALEWRGKLNVASMRGFTADNDVADYLRKLQRQGYGLESGFFRVYELTSDASPKNRTREFLAVVAGTR